MSELPDVINVPITNTFTVRYIIERTCTNIWGKEPEPKCDNGFKCSLCGYSVSDGEDWRVFTYEHEENGCAPWDCAPWRYCPGCGAKVVEHD